METVPRVHVQKLPATTEQQYQDEAERGVSEGPNSGSRSKTGVEKLGSDAAGVGDQRHRRTGGPDDEGERQRGQREKKRSGGQTQRLVAGSEVLLLCRRQTGEWAHVARGFGKDFAVFPSKNNGNLGEIMLASPQGHSRYLVSLTSKYRKVVRSFLENV